MESSYVFNQFYELDNRKCFIEETASTMNEKKEIGTCLHLSICIVGESNATKEPLLNALSHLYFAEEGPSLPVKLLGADYNL